MLRVRGTAGCAALSSRDPSRLWGHECHRAVGGCRGRRGGEGGQRLTFLGRSVRPERPGAVGVRMARGYSQKKIEDEETVLQQGVSLLRGGLTMKPNQ